MEIIAIVFFVFILIKFFRQIVVAGFSFFRLSMFMALPSYVLNAKYSSELFSNIASIIGEPLTIVIFFDVGLSIVSFINWIPIGKPWITPRLPIIPTIIVMLIQLKDKKRMFYCDTCHRNFYPKELIGVCNCCETEQKIYFMDITGRIYRKCINGSCNTSGVFTLREDDGVARTRISVFNPLKNYRANKINFKCKTCGSKIGMGLVSNFSLYGSDEKLVRDYRTVFFYYTFCKGKKTVDMSVEVSDERLLKGIDNEFEGSKSPHGYNTTLGTIRLRLKTRNYTVNQIQFRFNTAICSDNSKKLMPSEGIVLLLDGSCSNFERDSVVDQFLIDLKMLSSRGELWENPVFVGICANNCETLEDKIDSGILKLENNEEMCRQYLESQNNSDIINKLSNAVKDIHYFIYRTGTVAAGTDYKIYNVIESGQSLLGKVCTELESVIKK